MGSYLAVGEIETGQGSHLLLTLGQLLSPAGSGHK